MVFSLIILSACGMLHSIVTYGLLSLTVSLALVRCRRYNFFPLSSCSMGLSIFLSPRIVSCFHLKSSQRGMSRILFPIVRVSLVPHMLIILLLVILYYLLSSCPFICRLLRPYLLLGLMSSLGTSLDCRLLTLWPCSHLSLPYLTGLSRMLLVLPSLLGVYFNLFWFWIFLTHRLRIRLDPLVQTFSWHNLMSLRLSVDFMMPPGHFLFSILGNISLSRIFGPL